MFGTNDSSLVERFVVAQVRKRDRMERKTMTCQSDHAASVAQACGQRGGLFVKNSCDRPSNVFVVTSSNMPVISLSRIRSSVMVPIDLLGDLCDSYVLLVLSINTRRTFVCTMGSERNLHLSG